MTSRADRILASCRSFQMEVPKGLQIMEYHLAKAGQKTIEHFAVDCRFPDGEAYSDVPTDPSASHVLLFQSLTGHEHDSDRALFALLTTVRAYVEYGAASVTVFVPHLSYSRQDRAIPEQRRPVTAKLLAELLKVAGVDHIITIFSGAIDRLRELYRPLLLTFLDPDDFFVSVVKNSDPTSVLVAPDEGAVGLASRLAQITDRTWITATKERYNPTDVAVSFDQEYCFPKGKSAIIVDDLICSAGTLESAISGLEQRFGIEDIVVAVPHLRLTSTGVQRLSCLHQRKLLRKVYATDAVASRFNLPFVVTHSAMDLYAASIARIWLEATAERDQ